MNIPTIIEVITVVNRDAMVLYQNIYINDHEAALAEYNELYDRNKEVVHAGGTITMKRF